MQQTEHFVVHAETLHIINKVLGEETIIGRVCDFVYERLKMPRLRRSSVL